MHKHIKVLVQMAIFTLKRHTPFVDSGCRRDHMILIIHKSELTHYTVQNFLLNVLGGFQFLTSVLAMTLGCSVLAGRVGHGVVTYTNVLMMCVVSNFGRNACGGVTPNVSIPSLIQ